MTDLRTSVVDLDDRTQRGVRGGFDRIRESAKGLSDTPAGTLLAGGAIETLRRTIGRAVSAHPRYEDALVGVVKTTDSAGDALERLDRRMAALSVDPTIARSRGELLGLAEVAGQLGVEGVDNLSAFALTLSRLENAASDVSASAAAADLARVRFIPARAGNTPRACRAHSAACRRRGAARS